MKNHENYYKTVADSHLNKCCWVDLMNNVAGLTTGLTVEVVALNKDAVITQTSNPDVTFSLEHQLHTLPYV